MLHEVMVCEDLQFDSFWSVKPCMATVNAQAVSAVSASNLLSLQHSHADILALELAAPTAFAHACARGHRA